MSVATVSETAILQLVFNATAWAGYAANAATAPETNIAVALHTADPGAAGTLATNEATYTGYQRVLVPRDGTHWPVTGANPASVSPNAPINFPMGTGGAGVVSFFSTGHSGVGAQPILWSGTVTPSLSCGINLAPSLTTATTITLT
jgi:hypothetical protein